MAPASFCLRNCHKGKFLKKTKRITGIIILFAVIGWAFYLHLPVFSEGYLNAGDDHIHVAYSNELKRIWQEEGRPFGWSRLYGAGAPIFMLRPPGFYQATYALHCLSGLSVEESLKIVVIFGFCLYPLTVFIGARLLGIGFSGALFAGMLSPLGISLWGHTIDAYQYLGVHKQLLAILFFPIAVGSNWQVLKNGKYGILFALSFAAVFLSHPYIAYCFALLVPLMFIALIAIEPQWNWKRGLLQSVLWSMPVLLWIGVWLLPFITSPEIQNYNPYLERRDDFDVVVLTTAETLRQYFLGGILDTTAFAEPFGDHEWGWLNNGTWFRFPLITVLSFVGWIMMAIKPKSPDRGFMALSFLAAIILFIGPDDFPWLEWIPFSEQFQNIHAVFLFEWAALILSGMALGWSIKICRNIRIRHLRYSVIALLCIFIGFGYGNAVYERTKTAQKLINVRNIYTENGELRQRKTINLQWRAFGHVVQTIKNHKDQGNITAFPCGHEDSVLYNLLPLMVDRPVFISGFEEIGGLYELLLHGFRADLRDHYPLQRLLNIRFVVNSPYYRKPKMDWHDSVEPLYKDKFWELVKVEGNFGPLEPIPLSFAGFIGKESEWSALMKAWLNAVKKGVQSIPWIINLTHSGLKESDIERIRPFIRHLILGRGVKAGKVFANIQCIEYSRLINGGKKSLIGNKFFPTGENTLRHETVFPIEFERINSDRLFETFRVKTTKEVTPILFKQAFYRGWTARINGGDITIYRVSPGLQLVLVPRGEHLLTWEYTGPNNWRWAWFGFLLGFTVAGVLYWRDWKRRKEDAHKVPGNNKKYLPHIIPMICLIFLCVFTVQVIYEGYLKVPVIITPRWGNNAIENGHIHFNWNYIVGIPKEKQSFIVQIASDSEFKKIISTETVKDKHIRIDNTLMEGKPHYFRIRTVIDNHTYKWSRPVSFCGPARMNGSRL